jgi:diphthamide biosynthesis protein 7
LTLLGRKAENSSTTSAADNASGVLDGKWFEPALVGPGARLSDDDFFGHYASAHADGRILVHGVSSYKRPSSLDSDSSGTCHSPFQAMLLGESESPSDKDALCLALAWDNKDYKDMSHGANGTTANSDRATTPKTIDTRILSSYSDGHVAIHRIKSSSSSSTTTDDTSTARPRVDVTLEHHWEAHTLFRSHPAEVWCCNFLLQRQYYSAMDLCSEMTPPTPIVATGGDEGSWKGWDVRVGLTRPIFHESDIFGAGVTVISPHPRHDHIVAVGSYDETIALYDVRKLSSTSPPQVLHHSDPLGGGIWRCKWHPHDDDRLLVGAMHGGCQAVQYSASIFKASCDNSATTSTGQKDDDDGEIRFSIRQKFTKHQSMAYGADWIWYCLDTAEEEEERDSFTIVEAAASCSFYDRSMYLWKVTQEW